MPFLWDGGNLDHIARHLVTPNDVEDVFSDPHRRVIPGRLINGEWRNVLSGATPGGRILLVVYTRREGAIRVITAYRATPRVQRLYQQGR